MGANKLPIVHLFDNKTAELIFNYKMPAIFIFNDNETSEEIEIFKKVAKEFAGRGLIFSISTITENFGEILSKYLGVTSDDVN